MSLSLAGFATSRPSIGPRSMTQEVAFAFIAGASVFAAVLWTPAVLRDPDTLWHIATGGWILAHQAVPTTDVFSYTVAGRPWVAHEWLSQVILALAYRADGWTGLMILTAAAAGIVVGAVAFHVRRHVRTDHALVLVLLAAACCGPSLLARPHLVTLPVLTVWAIVLVSARARAEAPSLWWVPLMTVWANLHGGFLVGLALTAALAVEAVFDPRCDRQTAMRGWGLFVLATTLAATVTPAGIDTLFYPLRVMALHNLDQIQEWRSSDLGQLSGFAVAILLALYLGLTGMVRLPRYRVLLLLGLAFAAMHHMRNVPVFAVVATLLVLDALRGEAGARAPSRATTARWMLSGAVGLAAVISLLFRIELPMERSDEGDYAPAALAHVPAKLRAAPVLNEYGFGGLLIFSGIRPFVDGRMDLYGNADMATYFAIVQGRGDALEQALCRHNVEWSIFPPYSVVPALLDRTPGWRRLYADGNAVIHERDPQSPSPSCPARPAP